MPGGAVHAVAGFLDPGDRGLGGIINGIAEGVGNDDLDAADDLAAVTFHGIHAS